MRKLPLLIVAGLAAIAVVWTVPTDTQPDVAAPANTAGPVINGSACPAGYVIHIDPATGRPADPSVRTVPVRFDETLQNSLSTSANGLVEVNSPVPGGGVMVDLQGRFQNTNIATVDRAGNVTTRCLSSLPAGGVPDTVKTSAGDKDGEE